MQEQPPGEATGGPRPGDEVEAGTEQAGENVCPTCGGSGRSGGAACPTCNGEGVVTELVGEA